MNVELVHVNKSFGPVHANDDISLTIPTGSIQGILGENGAGKSTLMKILSGFYHADSGQILLDGNPVIINSPSNANEYGIGMLHQDPLDFPSMRVAEDLIIGSEGGLFPNSRTTIREFIELQEKFGFQIDPSTHVDSLTVGERQQLEILRLLMIGAKVLILDEPTTGISAGQKAKLFETLKKLAAEGMSIIFVSHKLEDVEFLCDKIAVFRQGKMVGEVKPPYITDKLVELMFGKSIKLDPRILLENCESALSVKDICIDDVRLQMRNISLDVNCGEVIGLSGMEGSGQRQLLRVLGGLMRPVSGEIVLHGKKLSGKPYKEFLNSGVSYVPASRMEEGLVPGLSLTDHFVLSEKQNGFFIDRDKAHLVTRKRIEEFNIKGRPNSTVESLSGGNQQRALLAMLREPLSMILLEHPTRGLDIESSIWIWNKLKERCKNGAIVFFTSADLEEILHYSDRVLVVYNGEVSEPLNATETSVEQLGQLIGGKGFGRDTR